MFRPVAAGLLALLAAAGFTAPAVDLGALAAQLESGDSAARREAIAAIGAAGEGVAAEDIFLPAWAAAAEDPSAEIRQAVAWFVGNYAIAGRETTPPEARAVALRLTRDDDLTVRRRAVGMCLARIDSPDEEITQTMLEAVMSDPDGSILQAVVNALNASRGARLRAQTMLLNWMDQRAEEPLRAMRAFETYEALMGRMGPNVEAFAEIERTLPPEQRRQTAIVFGSANGSDADAAWRTLSNSLSPEVRARLRRWNRGGAGQTCAAVADGFFMRVVVLREIESTPDLRLQGEMSLAPDELEEIESELEPAER